MNEVSVGIIGCGPSGASALFTFNELKKSGMEIPKLVCYDKQKAFGGLWNVSWETGVHSNGEMVHSSMYNHLWSNTPKEASEIPNYTYDEHFGFPIPSYPPGCVLKDYLEGYLRKSEGEQYCRFEHSVKLCEWVSEKQKFKLIVMDHVKGEIYEEYHDYVINAGGHFSTPNIVDFQGMNSFTGLLMHAHDFREALQFKGMRVCIIGSSFSAEDIGFQVLKYGATSVVLTWRSRPLGLKLGELNWTEQPLLEKVEGKLLTFKNGETAEVDAIIQCTGYKHSFPYMHNNLRLNSSNQMWVDGLWKGVVWEKNSKLLYLGMQNQAFTFNMFSTQAWFARDFIMGMIKLPSEEEVTKDDAKWKARKDAIKISADIVYLQGDYMKEICEMTDHPSFDIDGMIKTFIDLIRFKEEDVMNYRNHEHKSLITGTMGVKAKKPWLDNFVDDLEGWLLDYRH